MTVRIGGLQLAALQCHSQAFDDVPGEEMPATVAGGRLTFYEAERDELVAYLTDVSNSADGQAEEERRRRRLPDHDRAAMAMDRKMCAAIDRLAESVRRAV